MKEVNLPWYKRTVAKFLAGNIMLCELEAIGLFSIMEAIYWSRKCDMTKADMIRRIKQFPNHEKILDVLITEGIVKEEGDDIVIDYLKDQWEAEAGLKKFLSKKGKEGAEKANKNRKLRNAQNELPLQHDENKVAPVKKESPTLNTAHFYLGRGIDRKLFNIPISQYVRENLMLHIQNFVMGLIPGAGEAIVNKRIAQILAQMDKDKWGTDFNDNNHVRNTFKQIARELASGAVNKDTNTDTVFKKRNSPDTNK